MSLPAQPWPYAFWPARLDLALTGRSRLVPPSCKDSAPPLDALRPSEDIIGGQAALLGYVLPIAKAVPLPGFGAAKLGNRPFSERVQGSIPSRDEEKALAALRRKHYISGVVCLLIQEEIEEDKAPSDGGKDK